MNTDTDQTAGADQNRVKYTLNDCGCYVDGARGIYAIDKIVEIARSHGGTIDTLNVGQSDAGMECDAQWIEGDCDEFMNARFGVEGATWGRNENGDWGLWVIEEDNQPDDPTSLENSDQIRLESASQD